MGGAEREVQKQRPEAEGSREPKLLSHHTPGAMQPPWGVSGGLCSSALGMKFHIDLDRVASGSSLQSLPYLHLAGVTVTVPVLFQRFLALERVNMSTGPLTVDGPRFQGLLCVPKCSPRLAQHEGAH